MLTPTDEIKSKIDIVDLVQEYVKLQQVGTNWKARCPFHTEKTPSFLVSRDKQIWHCFGCAEGGDIFTFIQKIEGVEFPEALRLLAQKAGVILQKQDPAVISQRTRLLDINSLVAKYYHKVLLDSPVAASARQYLAKRQVDQLTIDQWQLGFAPDSWDDTAKFLQKRGFIEPEIFLAGLTVKKERGAGFYDRFRNRLMFPISDHHSQVVGFSARTLEPEAKEAKYINTPQTMIFNKGQLLFGLDKAKQEIKKQQLVVLVEGNMDVITSHQFGVTNVVASCGTALTGDQVKLLKRYSENVALSFDPDQAGQLASERGIDVALQGGLNVRVIQLPNGLDPDNFIKDNSVDLWQRKIKTAQPIMEYYFSRIVNGADLTSPEVKKGIVKKILPIIAKLVDKVEQTHWLQQLAEAVKVSENILRETLVKLASRVPSVVKKELAIEKKGLSRFQKQSEQLLAIILKYPDNLAYVVENLVPEALVGAKPRQFYTELIVWYNKTTLSSSQDRDFYIQSLQQSISQELAEYLNQLTLLIDSESVEELSLEKAKEEVMTIIKNLKREYTLNQLRLIEGQIKESETAGDQESIKRLLEKFSELTDQLYHLS
ncbi:MAG: DNA primase [Patescibacteria group bacterium]